MKFSDIVPRQLAALEAAIPKWRREAGAMALNSIRAQWPAPSWGDTHPFATGTSYEAWRVVEQSGASVTISCPVRYSGFTEEGYTRKGPETARSWSIRNYGRYSLTAINTSEIRSLTDSILRGAFNG